MPNLSFHPLQFVSSSRWSLLALLIILMGILLFFKPRHHSEWSPLLNHPAPIWFMNDTFTQVYDEKGQPQYDIGAERITAYTQGEFHFLKPVLQVNSVENVWHLQAQTGTAFQTEKGPISHIFLEQGVHLENLKNHSHLETQNLTYYPRSEKASTNALIHYTEPGLEMRGTGADLDIRRNRVKIRRDAQTIYRGKSVL